MVKETLTETLITKEQSKDIKNVINTTFEFTLELEPIVIIPKKDYNYNSRTTQTGQYKYNLEVSRLKNLYSKSYYKANPTAPVNKAVILEDVESILALYPNSYYDYKFLTKKLEEQLDLVLVEEKLEDFIEITNMIYE